MEQRARGCVPAGRRHTRSTTAAPRRDAVTLAACRGKLWQTKPDALGPLRDWSVPQSWFLHFYLLGAACNAATLAAFACCGAAAAGAAAAGRAALALALFQFHLMRRAAETALVMRYPRDARMHGIAYLFGLRWGSGGVWGAYPIGWERVRRGRLRGARMRPDDWMVDALGRQVEPRPCRTSRAPTPDCVVQCHGALHTFGTAGLPGTLLTARTTRPPAATMPWCPFHSCQAAGCAPCRTRWPRRPAPPAASTAGARRRGSC